MAGGQNPGKVAVTEKYNGTAWTEVGDMGTARSSLACGYSSIAAATTSFIAVTGNETPAPPKSTAVEEWNEGDSIVTFTSS